MTLRRRAHRVRVPGFRFAGVRCGLKAAGPDVALIVADAPAAAAGVFTRNRAPAAPVVIARERIAAGQLVAVLIHAGNANACTGDEGRRTVETSTALAASLLGCPAAAVAPCATGKIGVQVPRARLLGGVKDAVTALDAGAFPDAAQAICTTDAFPKTAVRRLRIGGRQVTVAALGKGAGMIAPDMATLLVFVLTDVRIAPAVLRRSLVAGVAGTLNAISVDGDASTNDTVLLLASGAAGNATVRTGSREHVRFTRAVTEVLDELARLVVLDGEGTTRLVQIDVRGARSDADARRVARSIADSMLCKAAFHGGDPNWGRLVMAAGNAGVRIDPARIEVRVGGVVVARRGTPVPATHARARARLRGRMLQFTVDLHLGRGAHRMWGADLSVAYVRFNAEYTT